MPCAGAGVVWCSRCPKCRNLQTLDLWISGLVVQLCVRGSCCCFEGKLSVSFPWFGRNPECGEGLGWALSQRRFQVLTAQGHPAELPKAVSSLGIWGWLQDPSEGCAGVTPVLWHSSELRPLLGCVQNQMNLGSSVGWFSSFLCISEQSVQIPVLQLREKIWLI